MKMEIKIPISYKLYKVVSLGLLAILLGGAIVYLLAGEYAGDVWNFVFGGFIIVVLAVIAFIAGVLELAKR